MSNETRIVVMGDNQELERQVRALIYDIIPKRDMDKLLLDIEKVKKASACLVGNDLEKNMAGSGSLWGFFPHFMDVKVGKVSMADKLKDEKAMEQIIKKTAAFCMKHENGKVSRNRVFQSLKAYNGHHVSNFRPVAARDIYLSLVGSNKRIFDPCAGWGGRLIGATASDCEAYIGVDASRKTADCFQDLINDCNMDYASVIHSAIEDVVIDSPMADIAFTSPPYFDAEKYSDDEEQSWVRYDTYDKWRDGFLLELCVKMRDSVERNGFVVINIADVKGLPICQDTNDTLVKVGLKYWDTYNYVLSSIAGKGKKTEPVFIYRK